MLNFGRSVSMAASAIRQRRTKPFVGCRQPRDHVVYRQGAVEVDLHVAHPDEIGVATDTPQQARLAVAPRRREAARVPPLGELQKSVGLVLTIDQLLGIQRLAEDEGVELHGTEHHTK